MDTLENASNRLVADPVAPPPSLDDLRARTARRQRRRTTGRLAAAVVVVGALVAGSLQLAGDDDIQDVEMIDGPESGSQTFQDLLRTVPTAGEAADDGVQLSMYDFAAAREALDIAPPSDDPDDVIRYVLELPYGVQGGLNSWGPGVMPDAVRAELGFDSGQVDRIVRAYTGSGPQSDDGKGDTVVISEGVVDPDTVDRTVRAVPYWGERTASEPVDGGATLYRWGDDPYRLDMEHRTPVRSLGRPHALAVADGWAAFTLRPDTALAAAELRTGSGPSLADSVEIRRLAELADRQGAHAVNILEVGWPLDDDPSGSKPRWIDWSMKAVRTGPEGTSATVAVLIDDPAAVAEAMELLADHDPGREGDLVWVTLEGAADAVGDELAEVSQTLIVAGIGR